MRVADGEVECSGEGWGGGGGWLEEMAIDIGLVPDCGSHLLVRSHAY